jgi:hypothetical protein
MSNQLPSIQKNQAAPPQGTTNSLSAPFKKDNIATTLVLEDHLKNMLSKTANLDYQPWKSPFAPKNPHSPFGDFPKEYMNIKKVASLKLEPIQEDSQAATTINKYTNKNQGTGGKSSFLLLKKPIFNAPVPIAGAFAHRKIPASEFRRYFTKIYYERKPQKNKLFFLLKNENRGKWIVSSSFFCFKFIT